MKLMEKDEMPLIQREEDGYINATALCKSAGKFIGDYFILEATNAFLNELSSVIGIPITELTQVRQGARRRNRERMCTLKLPFIWRSG